jgi:uncharacterized protein
MIRRSASLMSMIVCASVAGLFAAVATARAQEDGAAAARALVEDLAAGREDAVQARLSPQMAMALQPGQLQTIWSGLTSKFGALQGFEDARTEQKGGFEVVSVPARFARETIDLRVSIAQGKVVGFFLAPHQDAAKAWTPPSYADAAAFRDTDLRLGAPPMTVGATLSLPVGRGPFPAVILVHGSGPGDRDETVGANKPFRDLAQGLASKGIAVLRFDKRTRVYPQVFAQLKTPTVKDEVLDDVTSAIAHLRTVTEVDPSRVSVLGHSFGGTLAPRIASEHADVHSIVILAGASRPLPDIMVEQATYLAGLTEPQNADEKQAFTALVAGARSARAAKPGDVGPPILGAPPSYWGDLNAYDPAETAARLTLPILILQGERDYQVRMADLARFEAALKGHANAEIHSMPRLNHLFMAGDGPSTPKDYEVLAHVDQEVIERIANFLARR